MISSGLHDSAWIRIVKKNIDVTLLEPGYKSRHCPLLGISAIVNCSTCKNKKIEGSAGYECEPVMEEDDREEHRSRAENAELERDALEEQLNKLLDWHRLEPAEHQKKYGTSERPAFGELVEETEILLAELHTA
jgi:hypothetical protein